MGLVADHEAITTAIMTDVKIIPIHPGGSISRHLHNVVGGGICVSDIAIKINHASPVRDHQAVAAASSANVKVSIIGPARSCSRHGDNIIRSIYLITDYTIGVYHTSPVTDRQAITASVISHSQVTSNVQGGIGSRHQHTVVGRVRRNADSSIGVHHHTPLIRNHQTVAAALIAYKKCTTIRPRGSQSIHCHDVVGGYDAEVTAADVSVGIDYALCTSKKLGDHQTVAAAGFADSEISCIGPRSTHHQHEVIGTKIADNAIRIYHAPPKNC